MAIDDPHTAGRTTFEVGESIVLNLNADHVREFSA